MADETVLANPALAAPVTTVVASAPAKGSPEHAASMAAMAPANVPDKFKNTDGTVNVAALTEAYRALEVKQSAAPKPPVEENPAAPKGAEGVNVDALLDGTAPSANPWETAQAELAADGKISDATKKVLKDKNGVTDSMLSGVENGWKAEQAQKGAKLAEAVGGLENLKAVLTYAQTKYNPAQIKELRSALNGPSAPWVLKGLAAELQASRPAAPAAPKGEPRSILDTVAAGGGDGAVQPYASASDMIADIRSRKYQTDPAYRENAARRIALTSKGS
jgi:hypothetical protein